jgi:hypothetical protein
VLLRFAIQDPDDAFTQRHFMHVKPPLPHS